MPKGGRPKRYPPIKTIVELMDEYTNNEPYPILKDFCGKNGFTYDYINDLSHKHEELFHAIRRLLDRKEVVLEQGGVFNKLNPTMAIFSLKQLGWRDKPLDEHGIKDVQKSILDVLSGIGGGHKEAENKQKPKV